AKIPTARAANVRPRPFNAPAPTVHKIRSRTVPARRRTGRRISFFDTFAPKDSRYRSAKGSNAERRTKLRFPTPVSPITTTLALAFGASTAPHPGTLVKAADLVRAWVFLSTIRRPIGKSYAFGISLPGSRNGFLTTVAVRGPSG